MWQNTTKLSVPQHQALLQSKYPTDIRATQTAMPTFVFLKAGVKIDQVRGADRTKYVALSEILIFEETDDDDVMLQKNKKSGKIGQEIRQPILDSSGIHLPRNRP